MRNTILFLITLCFCGSLAAKDVGMWDRFERSIQNTNDYHNPYLDVDLKVTYTAPNGEKTAFWGFYDGGQTWKIRFMPDRLGTWKYTATFSDGSAGISGSFECVPSTIPGVIAKDESNPMWFGYAGGRHGLVRSFHVGDRFFAANWADDKRDQFLDWAENQGYNMLSIASHLLNRDSKGRGRGWDTPDLWPLDASEHQRMETILDDLANRHIMVFPFAGFLGKSSDFPGEQVIQEKYLRYTLARLAPYWNILYNIAGPEPLMKKHVFLTVEELTRIGRLLQKLDPFGHLIAVHNRTGHYPFRDAGWSDYVVLQGPKTTNRD
ncbi:DUF5060 domain-containing protein, partial [bacterium]|nr:DUF5060 domain-containing protein [bacterium]